MAKFIDRTDWLVHFRGSPMNMHNGICACGVSLNEPDGSRIKAINTIEGLTCVKCRTYAEKYVITPTKTR